MFYNCPSDSNLERYYQIKNTSNAQLFQKLLPVRLHISSCKACQIKMEKITAEEKNKGTAAFPQPTAPYTPTATSSESSKARNASEMIERGAGEPAPDEDWSDFFSNVSQKAKKATESLDYDQIENIVYLKTFDKQAQAKVEAPKVNPPPVEESKKVETPPIPQKSKITKKFKIENNMQSDFIARFEVYQERARQDVSSDPLSFLNF